MLDLEFRILLHVDVRTYFCCPSDWGPLCIVALAMVKIFLLVSLTSQRRDGILVWLLHGFWIFRTSTIVVVAFKGEGCIAHPQLICFSSESHVPILKMYDKDPPLKSIFSDPLGHGQSYSGYSANDVRGKLIYPELPISGTELTFLGTESNWAQTPPCPEVAFVLIHPYY